MQRMHRAGTRSNSFADPTAAGDVLNWRDVWPRVRDCAERRKIKVPLAAPLRRRCRCARQQSARRDVGQDPFLRLLPPGQIERRCLGKEIDLVKYQVIPKPPRKITPIPTLRVLGSKPWDGDTDTCAHAPFAVAPVPDMTRVVFLICRAFLRTHLRGSEMIERGRPVTRPDIHGTKGFHQRVQQFRGQLASRSQRKCGILWDIRYLIETTDFSMQKITKCKISAKALASQILERDQALRATQGFVPCPVPPRCSPRSTQGSPASKTDDPPRQQA